MTASKHRAPALQAAHNTTPEAVAVDTTGRLCPGNTTITVDPTDPVTAALVADRTLHLKEK